MFYLLDLERSVGTGVVHYWKGNRHGYTKDIMKAGLFDEETAKEIVKSDFDKRTVMIPEKVVKGIFK